MSEITIPFHGGKLVVPEREAASAWLDKVLKATTFQSLPHIGVPPALGEYWPGEGGIFAGIMPDGNGSQYPLIASADDFDAAEWGSYGVDEPDAKSDLDGHAVNRQLTKAYRRPPAQQRMGASDHAEKDS